jgi:ATP-dependent 26S proteasome regulatory subunit
MVGPPGTGKTMLAKVRQLSPSFGGLFIFMQVSLN